MNQIYNSFHPISIYQTSVDIDQKYTYDYINEIYRLGDTMNHSTNVKALMTSYTIFKESKVFNNLLSKIFSKCMECPWVDLTNNHTISTAWGSVYKDKEECVPHSHGNSLVSFVYYIKVDNFSSPLKFHTSPPIEIYPKSNDLIMFRGHITHSVPPQSSIGEDRVVLAGNIVEIFN